MRSRDYRAVSFFFLQGFNVLPTLFWHIWLRRQSVKRKHASTRKTIDSNEETGALKVVSLFKEVSVVFIINGTIIISNESKTSLLLSFVRYGEKKLYRRFLNYMYFVGNCRDSVVTILMELANV